MDVRALLGTFEGAPISGCARNSRVLASWTSKRNSYHFVKKEYLDAIVRLGKDHAGPPKKTEMASCFTTGTARAASPPQIA